MSWDALRRVRWLFAAVGAALMAPLALALLEVRPIPTPPARDPSCDALCPDGVHNVVTCEDADVQAARAEVSAKGCRGCVVRRVSVIDGQAICS